MSNVKILIVEDESIIALDLKARLINLGYQVCGMVASGEQALSQVAALQPGLVLMDIVLKGELDGVQTAERIRAQYAVPIIFVTAFADTQTVERAKATYPFGYILKPFEERELTVHIEMALYKHRMERELQASEAKFRSIYEQAQIGIELYDDTGKLVDCNSACLDIFGIANVDAVRGFDLFADPNVPTDAKQRLQQGETVRYESKFDFDLVRQHNLYATTKTGTCYVDCIIAPWHNDARTVGGFMVHVRDVSERKMAEEQLRYLGTHDALTGLYNRAFFEEEMARLEGGRQYPISIIMLDVNGLKKINDTQGHAMGDELLRRAAHMLKRAFRAEDVVARIGGDEFAVLLPQTELGATEQMLTRLRGFADETNTPSARLRLAVGVATARTGDRLEEILRQADSLMYANKKSL